MRRHCTIQTAARVAFSLTIFLLSGRAATAQQVTRCGVTEVVIDSVTTDLRLTGCGDGFTDNVLWHLDRADSQSGELDGKVTRPATGKGAVVYVFDSGIRADHDEFARPEGTNVIAGLDPARDLGLSRNYPCPNTHEPLKPCAITSPPGALFTYTHGTAVASVIAGRTTGVAPDAKLVSVLAVPAPITPGFNADALDSIIEHAWHPTTPSFRTAIVNMSLGLNYVGDAAIAPLEKKMREMIGGVDANGNPDPAGKRFLFVTVAGNFFDEKTGPGDMHGHCDARRQVAMFPGTHGEIDGLVVVGGITPENRLWDHSCMGAAVDILAPATNMLVASYIERDHYRSGRTYLGVAPNAGTSYAAPYVAGLAAILLEQYPDLTPEQLEARLKSSSSRAFDGDETNAGGRVAVFDFHSRLPRRRSIRR
jgi:subtilisin family serine protease